MQVGLRASRRHALLWVESRIVAAPAVDGVRDDTASLGLRRSFSHSLANGYM